MNLVPYPWTQAVLVYTVTTTNVTPAQMASAMAAVALDTADFPALSVTSDVTLPTGTGAQRTIVFALGADFNSALTSSADPTAFFEDFYTQTLSDALVAPVVASIPVVT